MNDDARRIILARRARFMAATLAGVGLSQGCATQSATCLSPPTVIEIDGGPAEPEEVSDAAAAPEPEPEPEADAGPAPRVCLDFNQVSPGTPPKKAPPPRICLSEY